MFKQNCWLLLAAFSLRTFAGPQGFPSLKILPGAREAGMGGAGCASASGPQAMVWNPAATVGGTSFAAVAGYAAWFGDSRSHSLFLSRQFGKTALGTGVRSFAAGSFEYRQEVPTTEPLGTFQPVEISGYLNLSRQIGDTTGRLHAKIGANLRYFYSKITYHELDGFGLDLGTCLHTSRLSLGMSLTDFGQTLTYMRERIWLPTRARAGAAFLTRLGSWNITATTDLSLFVYSLKVHVNSGLEIVTLAPLRFRAGYELRDQTGNLSLGLGLCHGHLALDYSMTFLDYDMGSAHRVSLRLTL